MVDDQSMTQSEPLKTEPYAPVKQHKPTRRRTKTKRRSECFFGIHLDLHPAETDKHLGRAVTAGMVDRFLRAVRPDFLQYDCKGHIGLLGYPNSRVSRSAPGIIADSLKVYRAVTRKHGVPLYVHFSGVWDKTAVTDHPEWAVWQADGSRSAEATSLFSEYVDRRMIPQMLEVLQRYDVDGFWIDGDCWAVHLDHHPDAIACLAELAWTQIHRERFSAYVEHYLKQVRSRWPAVQITTNWLYSPMAPERVGPKLDYLSGDLAHADGVNNARFAGRVLASYGTTWDLMSWGFGVSPGLEKIHKPAIQLMQEAAQVIALGGAYQIYYQPRRDGLIADSHIQTMRRVGKFCRQHKKACCGGEPLRQVAVLLDTVGHYKASPYCMAAWSGQHDAIQGSLQLTLDSGFSAEVVCDHQARGRFADWPAVVVPPYDFFAEGIVEELIEYARGGGALLVLGAKACAAFAQAAGLCTVAETDSRLHQMTARGEATPVMGPWCEIDLKPRARVYATRVPQEDYDAPAVPAAIAVKVGRGQLGLIPGGAAESYFRAHSPVLREVFGTMLRSLFVPVARISTPGVDLVLRRRGSRVLAHLINCANIGAVAGNPPSPQNLHTSSRYPVFETLPPATSVQIELPYERRSVQVKAVEVLHTLQLPLKSFKRIGSQASRRGR
jgi:hypothetical protein